MSPPLILIVDDDPDVVAGLGRTLRRAGYATVAAFDGEGALREAASAHPGLVISDILMPGINGFQLTRQLRAEAATANIPVILISGKTDPADRFWASEVGARVLLRKPVEEAQLLREIAAALEPPV